MHAVSERPNEIGSDCKKVRPRNKQLFVFHKDIGMLVAGAIGLVPVGDSTSRRRLFAIGLYRARKSSMYDI
jgi:hypothetical protein